MFRVLVRPFSCLTLGSNGVIPTSIQGQTPVRGLQTTCVNNKAPVSARGGTKVDPLILRNRQEKRRKKLTKALEKMNKRPRMKKPIEEFEVPVIYYDEASIRDRRKEIEFDQDIEDKRAVALKDWQRFCNKRAKREFTVIDRAIISQDKALEHLHAVDNELYKKAIAPDDNLFPFEKTGPTRTPAVPGYLLDGAYANITKQYVVNREEEDMESFINSLTSTYRPKKKKLDDED